ncbi:MAG: chromosomal replication initiator protein DnaA, partial [Mesorhizobium sp.]
MQSGGIEREIASELPFPTTYVGGDGMAASNDAEQKFERVKAQLKARLGAEVYSSWFGRMKVAEASRGIVRISVPTAFLRSWINGHYLDLIAELWRHEEPDLLKIEIVVRTATRQGRNHVEPEVAPARKMTK